MKKVDLIFFSSDTGLAGAFNSNLLKASQKFFQDHAGAEISLTLVGRKGRDYYRRRNGKILQEHVNSGRAPHVSGCGRHREAKSFAATATARPTRFTSSTTNSRA